MNNKALLLFLAAALVLGIVLRFLHLNAKVFWIDEVSTAWVASGYTQREVASGVDGHRLHPDQLLQYQHNESSRSVAATVEALARGDQAHPPLYYVLLHLWRNAFGSSVVATRALSALLGLLIPPAVYVLCVMLFESSLVGWIGMALTALSPFFIYYAQDAREYSLFALLAVVSSIALLNALRRNARSAWIWYGLTVLLGLYASLLFLGTLAAQAVYVLLTRGSHKQSLRAFIVVSIAALAIFTPWLWTVVQHQRTLAHALEWITTRSGILAYVASFVSSVFGLFFWTGWPLRLMALAGILATALVAASGWYVARHATPQTRTYLLWMALLPAAVFVIIDLVVGGERALISRYVTQFYLVIDICVAYVLADRITNASDNISRARLWGALTLLLLAASGFSSLLQSNQPAAWDSERNAYVAHSAEYMNSKPAALLAVQVYKNNLLDASVLSYFLRNSVAIQFITRPDSLDIRPRESAFVLNPSPDFVRRWQERGVVLRRLDTATRFPIFEYLTGQR